MKSTHITNAIWGRQKKLWYGFSHACTDIIFASSKLTHFMKTFFFISRQLSFISYNNNFYDANMTYNENAREKICGLLDHIEMGCCRNEFCGKTIFLLNWFNFEGFYNVDKKTSYERKNHVSTLLKFLYNHSDGAAINIGYRVKLMA